MDTSKKRALGTFSEFNYFFRHSAIFAQWSRFTSLGFDTARVMAFKVMALAGSICARR
ncbi:MAG: hypothetical protein WA929_00840 [Pseudomonas neustonica]|tara:strand:- start:322 stop:495 length:174 start_codon:yes stop_codon:yes gene_type:complete